MSQSLWSTRLLVKLKSATLWPRGAADALLRLLQKQQLPSLLSKSFSTPASLLGLRGACHSQKVLWPEARTQCGPCCTCTPAPHLGLHSRPSRRAWLCVQPASGTPRAGKVCNVNFRWE